MRKNLFFMAALSVATGFGNPIPMAQSPYNVANRIDLTKFSAEQIQADAMRTSFNTLQKKKSLSEIKREVSQTKTYFAIQKSMYSGYSFAYLSGDVLSWNVDVTIDGTTATISNLFNLDDPTNSYDTTTEADLIGYYDADAKTITIPTPTEFENATIAGMFYGVYPAVLSSGTVDSQGTLTPTSDLVFTVNDDLSMISTEQDYGVSMYAADGSMSWGFQEIFARSILTIPTEESNIISFAEAIDFGAVYPNYPLTSNFKLINAGNTEGDFVASVEGDGFTLTPQTGTIQALSMQDFQVTYVAPEANQEYEGIITITTDQGDTLVQLMGTSIPYPDYSALIKGGEMTITTGMDWPFAVDTELIEGKTVGKSTIPGGTGGNQESYIEVMFEVPEGQIGTFSWSGYCNSAVWHMGWGGVYFDGSTTYAYQWKGGQNIDIANCQKFAPGKHTARFHWWASSYGGGADDILVVYDLLLQLEDAVDYKATIDKQTVEFGNFIYNGEPISSTQTVTLCNEGMQPLKVTGATSTENFSVSIPETEAELLQYLPVTIFFNAEAAGSYEGEITLNTTAGDFKLRNLAFVREMPDFSSIVEEGDFIFETNADNPYIMHQDGYAYNSTSKVIDNTPKVSYLKCSFVIPEGKLGILSWDADVSYKSQYDENHNFVGGDSFWVIIQQPMNSYWWSEYFYNTTEPAEFNLSSETMIAKSDEFNDNSKYTMFTPGESSYIRFEYAQGGDGAYLGEDRLRVNKLKLELIDFEEYSAKVDKDEVTFSTIYEGKQAKDKIRITNMGSANLEFISEYCDGPFKADLSRVWSVGFQNYIDIPVEFNPTEEGTFENDLIIKTNAGDIVIKCKGEAMSTYGILLLEDFEDNAVNWQAYDRDGDGSNWNLAYNLFGGVPQPYVHGGEDALCSVSYDNYYSKALTPDNWAISPKFTIPVEHNAEVMLTWWISAQLDGDKLGDHYSVYIMDETLPELINPEDFDCIHEETVENIVWEERKVEISKYAGKTIRVAFRHHDCEGKWIVKLDDVIVFDGVSGINLINASKEVVRIEYYSIDGIRVTAPKTGIYLVKTVYTDGTATTRKTILNNN